MHNINFSENYWFNLVLICLGVCFFSGKHFGLHKVDTLLQSSIYQILFSQSAEVPFFEYEKGLSGVNGQEKYHWYLIKGRFPKWPTAKEII